MDNVRVWILPGKIELDKVVFHLSWNYAPNSCTLEPSLWYIIRIRPSMNIRVEWGCSSQKVYIRGSAKEFQLAILCELKGSCSLCQYLYLRVQTGDLAVSSVDPLDKSSLSVSTFFDRTDCQIRWRRRGGIRESSWRRITRWHKLVGG